MTLLILLVLIVGGVVAYRYRVQLIAKITGQKEIGSGPPWISGSAPDTCTGLLRVHS